MPKNREDHIVILVNLTPVPRESYRIGVPDGDGYQVVMNTDSHFYCGSNYEVGDCFLPDPIPTHGQKNSLAINVPPLATIFLKPRSLLAPEKQKAMPKKKSGEYSHCEVNRSL